MVLQDSIHSILHYTWQVQARCPIPHSCKIHSYQSLQVLPLILPFAERASNPPATYNERCINGNDHEGYQENEREIERMRKVTRSEGRKNERREERTRKKKLEEIKSIWCCRQTIKPGGYKNRAKWLSHLESSILNGCVWRNNKNESEEERSSILELSTSVPSTRVLQGKVVPVMK